MILFRRFVLYETLLGMMTVLILLTPSYGQQEIEPSWYDPWAKATATSAHSKYTNSHPTNLKMSLSKMSTVPKKRSRKENSARIS